MTPAERLRWEGRPDPWVIHVLQDKIRARRPLTPEEQRWLAFDVADWYLTLAREHEKDLTS